MSLVSRIADSISPPRMGRDFRNLLASAWITNIGDGLAFAAGPLLVASQTRDPFLVALAAALQRLPWLLFGLHAGVVADRLDRRRVAVAVNLVRALVLAALSLVIVTGQVNVPIVLVVAFLLGTAETFADTAATTLLPMVVDKADLGAANARFMVGHITGNDLIGPPIGAGLFAVGMVVPFATQAVGVALGALLIARMAATRPTPKEEQRRVVGDIVEGLRWVWRDPAVRTLTLTIVTFNVTYGAVLSILVLYTSDRLGLDEVGFGLLLAASAIGGILGSSIYGWLERRLGPTRIMRGGLMIEATSHLVLAVTTTPLVAAVTLFVFGIHEAAWGTTSSTARQRLVPMEMQGRVGSTYMLGLQGGLVVGAALGGLIAGAWGLTGPFWFAFVGSVLILAAIWRELGHIGSLSAAAT
ncbi:MAG TPA: MFS transporter [Acidimicrobiia bacterium]|jgi:MFS family permease